MRVATIDELHSLAETLIRQTEELPQEKKKKEIIDSVYELLVLAYIYGIERVQQDIARFTSQKTSEQEVTEEQSKENEPDEESVPYNTEDLYKALYRSVGGETFEQRISKRIDEGTLNTETLRRIIETDYHRMEETGAYDRATSYAKRNDLMLFKVWKTMRDDRVRETHWYIENVEVPADERFYTFDGDSARFPGDFELVENNANCRCEVRYLFR